MTTTDPSTAVHARAAPHGSSKSDFRALLLESLRDRWQTFDAELKRCRRKYSEAAVHDLRVATRRLISTLDLVQRLPLDANLAKARRALKKQLDMFGPLRDVQVQLGTIDKMLVSFPELQAFLQFLAKQERQLTRRLSTDLKRVRTRKIEKRIVAAVRELEALPRTAAVQQVQRAAALLAIETAYNRVIERKQAITPSDGAAIHRMRVAFKKFRYLVEVTGPLRGRITSRQFKAMNTFQGLMGDIQDAEVLLGTARSFADKHGLKGGATFARALEELSRQRTDAIATFLEAADTIFTFWKPSSKFKGGQ